MSTYLDLTNELLRRLNEVELTTTTFASARGIQAAAKDCIRASINEILSSEKEWSFNSASGTQILTVGQEQYTLPADCESPDWESFRILQSNSLNVNTTPLRLISRDTWYQGYRSGDEDSGVKGKMMPQYVFMSTTGAQISFGVTPSPDRAYTIGFDYYVTETELNAYSDVVRIPVKYNYVIIAGGLKHFNFFKDNNDQGAFWTKEFTMAMSKMRSFLAPRKDNVRDTRVNFGGPFWRSAFDDF